MDNDKLKEKIDFYKNKKLEIELHLKELEGLMQNENVRRFLELLEYDNDENRKLLLMNDDELEKYSEDMLEEEDKVYFRMGKKFCGFKRNNDSYMILSHSYDDYELLSHYVSLTDSGDEVIIPYDDSDEFEKNHNIVYCDTLDSFDEYNKLSKEYKEKLLKKRY